MILQKPLLLTRWKGYQQQVVVCSACSDSFPKRQPAGKTPQVKQQTAKEANSRSKARESNKRKGAAAFIKRFKGQHPSNGYFGKRNASVCCAFLRLSRAQQAKWAECIDKAAREMNVGTNFLHAKADGYALATSRRKQFPNFFLLPATYLSKGILAVAGSKVKSRITEGNAPLLSRYFAANLGI